jgi:hypothetical protein
VKVTAGVFALQYTFKTIKSLQHELYNMPREKGTNYDKADRKLLDELHWRKDGSLVSHSCFVLVIKSYSPRYPPGSLLDLDSHS